MKIQFYFKTNNDYISFVGKLGYVQGGEAETVSLLRCSGKPVRVRRSLRGHLTFYFDAYEGASLVLGIESGSVTLTTNSLDDALEIRNQFPRLLTPTQGEKLEVTETGSNIPAPVVGIIGGKEYPRATPVTPASAPLLRMLGTRDLEGQQEPNGVSSQDSRRKKEA